MSESSQRTTIEGKVMALCEPLIAAEGLELLEVEYRREQGRWILRLYIDKPGGRVGVEECAIGSRAVDRALDVEDIIPHEYFLEVSSPGLDRPLTRKGHFERVKGEKVKVKTFAPLFEPPRKSFPGQLVAVTDDGIEVEVEGAGRFTIAYKDIARATLDATP